MKPLTSILLLGGAANYGTLAFAPSANPIQQRTLAAVKTVNLDQPAADSKYCIPLDKISLDDLPKVGGKTASLGEMIQQLTPLGVAVPGGFGVTSAAYDAVLDRFELRERLELLLRDVDVNNLDDLAREYDNIGHSYIFIWIWICSTSVALVDALSDRGKQVSTEHRK